MTEQHEGLMEFQIGDKIFYPIYEDIALGLKKPDIKEILKRIAAVK
jgi:trans-2-enoyl-CoA reductase